MRTGRPYCEVKVKMMEINCVYACDNTRFRGALVTDLLLKIMRNKVFHS
jgi:hypothetical protein